MQLCIFINFFPLYFSWLVQLWDLNTELREEHENSEFISPNSELLSRNSVFITEIIL